MTLFKRTAIASLAALLLALVCALSLQLANPETSYADTPRRDAETSTLAFYGTTAIRVPEGTVLDYEHDARFRVFARNHEDLDLTSRIKATTSPTFDTQTPLEAGEYQINYTVTADDGKTITLTVPVTVEANGTEVWLQKTMYTLPSVDHLNSTGYTRGNNMDRQIVGVFLDEGNGGMPSIQMRRINGTKDLAVTFRKNDNWLESTFSLTGKHDAATDEGWVSLTNTGQNKSSGSLASVPFVKTLYAQPEDVIYEVKWDATDPRIQPLHYYHVGDGVDYQNEFMSQWQSDADSFAVIDGVSILALLPYEDSQNIIREMNGKSLTEFDTMLDMWDYVTDCYDDLIGISYDAAEPWNKAVKSKYFARADAHGAGMAFYSSGECIGYNAPTKTWSLLLPQWGTFHEYGHGYQGNVGGSDQYVSLTEIGVNIFSYYVQEMSDLSAKYNGNWIGNIDSKEDDWAAKRNNGMRFVDTQMGSDATLYALINPLYSTDYVDVYSSINKYFRETYNNTGKKLPIFDTWAIVFCEKYGLNLVPYLESWGLYVSDSVKNELMASGAEPLYYIRDMVSDGSVATDIKKEDGKKGEYDLISMSEFAKKGYTGSVKFTFDIDDFDAIRGKVLLVNDGDREVVRIPIESQEESVELPAGVYKVAPPIADNNYLFKRLYIVVPADGENAYTIEYSPSDQISGGNDVIIACRGYWSEETRPFSVQVKGRNMVFDYQDTYPNSGWTSSDKVFSKLTLNDTSGKTVYEKSVNGGWYDEFFDDGVAHVEIPIDEGYELTVYYEHPSDMRFTSQLTGEAVTGYDIPNPGYSRTYVVTKFGLVPKDLLESDEEAVYQMFKERVTKRADQLLDEIGAEGLHDPFKTSPELVNQLNMLIKDLREEDQEPYVGTFLTAETPGGVMDPDDAGEADGSGSAGSGDGSSDGVVDKPNNGTADKPNKSGRVGGATTAGDGADKGAVAGADPVSGSNGAGTKTAGSNLSDKAVAGDGVAAGKGNGSSDPADFTPPVEAGSIVMDDGGAATAATGPAHPDVNHVDEEHHFMSEEAEEEAGDILGIVALGVAVVALGACAAFFITRLRKRS